MHEIGKVVTRETRIFGMAVLFGVSVAFLADWLHVRHAGTAIWVAAAMGALTGEAWHRWRVSSENRKGLRMNSEQGLCKVNDPDFGKRQISREPDALIDEKLFGHKVHWMLCGSREVPYRTGWHDFGMPFSVPHYHSDIKDAWTIVEELRKRGITMSIGSRKELDPAENNCDELIRLKDEKYKVQRWNADHQRYDAAVYGKTAEEVICKAALQIVILTK